VRVLTGLGFFGYKSLRVAPNFFVRERVQLNSCLLQSLTICLLSQSPLYTLVPTHIILNRLLSHSTINTLLFYLLTLSPFILPMYTLCLITLSIHVSSLLSISMSSPCTCVNVCSSPCVSLFCFIVSSFTPYDCLFIPPNVRCPCEMFLLLSLVPVGQNRSPAVTFDCFVLLIAESF